jgi:hypothetical protein
MNLTLKEALEKVCFTVEQDGVYLPIDNNWKNISFSLSGGADSALLAYLICSKLKNVNVHIISNIRMWKTRPWQRHVSIEVFNYLKDKFPNHNFYRYENFISPEIEYGAVGPVIKDRFGKMKSGDQIMDRSVTEYICFYQNVDIWFSGVTRNPRVDSITNGMSDRNVEYTGELDLHFTFLEFESKLVSHPFVFVSKDWVVKQYKDLGLLDLFNLTRSCEGEFKGLDYTNYSPGQHVPECRTCFWCQERNWAKTLNDI